jgi:AraC family transcriptional regulator, positive regulator of tynA and feaB
MPERNDADIPRSDFEAWRASFRSSVDAQYALECAEPDAFTGWVRPLSMFGFPAVDVACSKNRFERTQRDIRLDGVDLYGVLFQMLGRSMASQNGQTIHLAEGDIWLIDKSRPAFYVADSEGARLLHIPFPRWPLISHLGFEPRGGSFKRTGTPAARLLYEFALNSLKGGDA